MKATVVHDNTGYILGIYLEDKEGKRMVYSCNTFEGKRPAPIISARQKEGYEIEYVLEDSGFIEKNNIKKNQASYS